MLRAANQISFPGKRLPDEKWQDIYDGENNGSYAKVAEDHPAYRMGYRWYVHYGTVGAISCETHEITEYEDGTITVTPSLVMPPSPGVAKYVERWHGFLRRGRFEGYFEYVLNEGMPCALCEGNGDVVNPANADRALATTDWLPPVPCPRCGGTGKEPNP